MAENLLSNNIEFNNQMFLPEDEEDQDSDIIVMRDQRNNFSNPVYESMYEQNAALVQQEQPTNADEEDPESVDLLTERHRGNISL